MKTFNKNITQLQFGRTNQFIKEIGDKLRRDIGGTPTTRRGRT